MENMQYDREQRLFAEASRLMQILTEGNFEPIEPIEASTFDKFKTMLQGGANKQLKRARMDARSNLKMFMGMFANYTYKREQDMTDANLLHTIVKFRETARPLLDCPEMHLYYCILDNSLENLITLPHNVTMPEKVPTAEEMI